MSNQLHIRAKKFASRDISLQGVHLVKALDKRVYELEAEEKRLHDCCDQLILTNERAEHRIELLQRQVNAMVKI